MAATYAPVPIFIGSAVPLVPNAFGRGLTALFGMDDTQKNPPSETRGIFKIRYGGHLRSRPDIHRESSTIGPECFREGLNCAVRNGSKKNPPSEARGIFKIRYGGYLLSRPDIHRECSTIGPECFREGLNPHCSYIGGEVREKRVKLFSSSGLCTTDFRFVNGRGFSLRIV